MLLDFVSGGFNLSVSDGLCTHFKIGKIDTVTQLSGLHITVPCLRIGAWGGRPRCMRLQLPGTPCIHTFLYLYTGTAPGPSSSHACQVLCALSCQRIRCIALGRDNVASYLMGYVVLGGSVPCCIAWCGIRLHGRVSSCHLKYRAVLFESF